MAVNVALVGNVGKDPQTRTFNNGKSITTFSVGVSQGYFDQQNQWVDQGTMWLDVEPITRQAQEQVPYVTKGAKVVVTGLLSQRFYTDKQGNNASSLKVAAHAIGFLHKPQQQAPVQQQWGQSQQYAASTTDLWATPAEEPEF